MRAAIDRREERIARPGGGQCFVRVWTPPAPRATLLLVHGYGEHGGRYEQTGSDLARHGYRVWCGDLRGHGRSGGPRGHVSSFDEYLDDVAAVRERATSEAPTGAVFLVGHSMGGLVALLYALQRPERLAALALSSPLLKLHPDVDLPPWLSLPALWLGAWVPRLAVRRGAEPTAVSRDPEVVTAYRSDPLVLGTTTFGWYRALHAALERAWSRAPDLRVPTWLTWAGADRLVDPEAHARWAARAPTGRVTASERPGLFHELFNEPERDEVIEDLARWLEGR